MSRSSEFLGVAYAHIPKKSQDKLSAHSLPCTFLGFSQQCSAFHLMHQLSQRFIKSHDIIFDEGGPTSCQECIILKSNTNNTLLTPSTSVPPSPFPSLMSYPKHVTRPPIPDDNPRYSVSSYSHCTNITDIEAPEPKTYNKVMASPDTVEWLTVCEDKTCTWKNLDVYNIIPQPKGWKVIRSKWVFHVKCGPDGSIQKYKACIITQGFTQVKGIDFNQMFAPVTKFSSLHTIFALAAEQNLEVYQMDIKAAYLNAHLEEEIYMMAPPGFNIPNGHILKLKKSIYGMKQGG
jgi:hypothetical protein